ncbi:hypothetical protein [Streptomyces sp. SID13726]|uniref:hypothetical protein n=1 Tax=Streptomyces sp. SID13726 TaxID=2706058 RepID=UPI0013BC0D75|nr:hypothetical protein [Streptomyces sp. SID13726]NEA99801.1 hypothetical protein [Streptomyces sp. SID13726]
MLVLAAFNLLRSAISISSLIGPAVLAAAALCGLALSRNLDVRSVVALGTPLLLAGLGLALLLSASRGDRRNRWSRVFSTGRVRVPLNSDELLVFRAVCGELRADLTAADTSTVPSAVHITAVAGHVHLLVPRFWRVRLHTSGKLLTRVTEGRGQDRTPESAIHQGDVDIHLLAVCSAVSIAYG